MLIIINKKEEAFYFIVMAIHNLSFSKQLKPRINAFNEIYTCTFNKERLYISLLLYNGDPLRKYPSSRD